MATGAGSTRAARLEPAPGGRDRAPAHLAALRERGDGASPLTEMRRAPACRLGSAVLIPSQGAYPAPARRSPAKSAHGRDLPHIAFAASLSRGASCADGCGEPRAPRIAPADPREARQGEAGSGRRLLQKYKK